MTARLCIDIDNVVAETDAVLRRLIRDHSSSRVDLNYDDVIEFDYRRCVDRFGNSLTDDDWHDVHENRFSTLQVLLEISPMLQVQEHLARLAVRFELHLVTSRRPQARQGTVQWLENHSFPDHRLHFVNHLEKHSVLGSFRAAVEDDPAQAELFAKAGVHTILLAHPWNVIHCPQVIRLRSWSEIEENLVNLAAR